MQPIEIAGQIISLIAVILSFITYQMKSKKGIMVMLSVATGISCIAYALLGGTVALVLNLVSIVRNVCFYHKDKKILSSKAVPIVLALIMGFLSIFTWEGAHSVFFVVGLMLNTLAMGYFNAQNLRWSILLTSSLIMIYNLFIPSIGGTVNEVVAITSAVIGLIRYANVNKENKSAKKGKETPYEALERRN